MYRLGLQAAGYVNHGLTALLLHLPTCSRLQLQRASARSTFRISCTFTAQPSNAAKMRLSQPFRLPPSCIPPQRGLWPADDNHPQQCPSQSGGVLPRWENASMAQKALAVLSHIWYQVAEGASAARRSPKGTSAPRPQGAVENNSTWAEVASLGGLS